MGGGEGYSFPMHAIAGSIGEILPSAGELPATVPTPADLDAALQQCDSNARMRPCESWCWQLLGRPAGPDHCEWATYAVDADHAGAVTCPFGVP